MLLLLVFVLFVLAIVPTRRLARAGAPPIVLLVYLLLLMGIALVAIELRGPMRIMIPLVVLLYLLPFAVPPGLLARLVRRRVGGPGSVAPAPRNVTPSDVRIVEPPGLGDGRPPVDAPSTSGASPDSAAPDSAAPDSAPPASDDSRS